MALFDFFPLQPAIYTVTLQCNGANQMVCGSFFASMPSAPFVFKFLSALPTDAAFQQKFIGAVAQSAGLATSAQVVNFNAVSTRRRTGFAVTVEIIGTQTSDSTASAGLVTAAATTSALNNRLAAAGVPTVASFSFNGGADVPAGTATPAPTPIPTPGAAAVTAAPLMLIMSVVMAAILALFH